MEKNVKLIQNLKQDVADIETKISKLVFRKKQILTRLGVLEQETSVETHKTGCQSDSNVAGHTNEVQVKTGGLGNINTTGPSSNLAPQQGLVGADHTHEASGDQQSVATNQDVVDQGVKASNPVSEETQLPKLNFNFGTPS